MEEILQKLYKECLQELKSIGLEFENNKDIGEINITLSKRKNKRYFSRCLFILI